MENNSNLHPENWELKDLITYMITDMNRPLDSIVKLSKEEMVTAILKDEIDKE